MKKKIILMILLLLVVTITGCTTKKEKKEEKKYIEDNEIKESIFKDSYKKASKLVTKMTIEEKIGQLFLVSYDKYYTNKYTETPPGGYLLFAKDFQDHTKESMKSELDTANQKSKYPLVFAADEEGGYVTRISRFKEYRDEKFNSPKYYYETGKEELLKETEKEKANLLKSIGINLNLAPVADVSTNENDFIYNRTFGRNATETSELIKKMIEYANENGINSCLKHFPGYGNNEDTHTGVAIDNRDYKELTDNDYLPFKSGIEAKAPCVLVSHNIINSIDSEYPASLSGKVIYELRNNLNFSGIIITDDLSMDAVKSYVEDGNAATLAIQSGNDMIITSEFEKMYNEVLNSYKEGTISEETINKAVLRIIAWKYESNLF
ncbi:MAG: beta-hexosaminidase [Bacilli bacterium]|nr:beta-hexosaminidase [Bacilli bacterium]